MDAFVPFATFLEMYNFYTGLTTETNASKQTLFGNNCYDYCYFVWYWYSTEIKYYTFKENTICRPCKKNN